MANPGLEIPPLHNVRCVLIIYLLGMAVTVLIFGIILFLGAHSISIVAPAWRDTMRSQLGGTAWKSLFSAVSVIGILLIIKGYGDARLVQGFLYHPPVWLRHVNALLMLLVFPLLLAAYFPGRIKTTVKHPVLVATKTWALAHLLANGGTADLVLFGSFLTWAVANRISLKRRTPRKTPQFPASSINDAVVVIGGLMIFTSFTFWIHKALFGVSPF